MGASLQHKTGAWAESDADCRIEEEQDNSFLSNMLSEEQSWEINFDYCINVL